MTFAKGQVYEFHYSQFKFMGGKRYFLLTYGNDRAETMPGFEDNGWLFRVEMLDYQKTWEPNEIPDIFHCYVAGFMKDSDGTETAFPVLKQDLGSILKATFSIGKSYPFAIAACPGTLDDKQQKIDCYLVTDTLGLTHYFHSQTEYKIGDSVELAVDKIGAAWLEFVDPVRQAIRETFEIGKKYTFLIETEELDDKNNLHFYALRDTVKGFLHRFYFKDERKDGPGDKIELEVKLISDKGWLILAEPGSRISERELSALVQIEDHATGREDEHMEFKSSFVFTASGEKNIDLQLGREIMQQLAAFMNADGGTIFLGYRDSGEICGINGDIPYLNSSTDDEYTYQNSLDGLELKIRNTITRNLGGFANSLVTVQFRKTETGLLVCHLITGPSTKPVYLFKTKLYKRSGNMCQRLTGDEITFFIIDHLSRIMQNAQNVLAQPAPEPIPEAAAPTEVVKNQNIDSLAAFLPKPPDPADAKLWQYLTLYKDGTVSRQKKESGDTDVLFNIPLTTACKKKSSRLLFCYANGCINVLNPMEVVDKKLSCDQKKYSNGYNKDNAMLYPLVCGSDDFLVIRSCQKDGTERIKAIALDNYAVHDPLSMQTKGNVFLDPKQAVLESVEVIPAEQSSFIYPVLMKSKNGLPGYPASQHPNVMAFLKRKNQVAGAASAGN